MMKKVFSSGIGAGVVSFYSLSLLLAALCAALYLRSESMLNIIVGAIIANAGTCVQFYVGSSRSSQSKDSALTDQLASQKGPIAP
jgi:hypothetical protein